MMDSICNFCKTLRPPLGMPVFTVGVLLIFMLTHPLAIFNSLCKSNFRLCAQPRVCSLTGENPVYPRPNQPDISESWDGISNGA